MVEAAKASARWPNWVWGVLAVPPVLAAAFGAWQAASVLAALALGCAAGQRLGRAAAPPPAPVAQPAPAPAVAQEALSSLRHDLNGILSPALLIADRLAAHADPAVQKAAEVVATTVERAAARVAKAKASK